MIVEHPSNSSEKSDGSPTGFVRYQRPDVPVTDGHFRGISSWTRISKLSAVIVLTIALATVAAKVVKAASADPVGSLRRE